MSEAADKERADIRAEEKNARLEAFLLELLGVIRARARGQPAVQIAAVIGRSERTVLYRYHTLEELDAYLDTVERKGIKKSQY